MLAAPPSPPPARSEHIELPLAALREGSGPLRLTGANGQGWMALPVAARERVLDARLHLVYSHSISLVRQRSQLALRLNQRTVAQLALDPAMPEMAADIRLPVDWLQSGYNPMGFVAVQHSVPQGCEDGDAAELWTEIDTQRSTVTLEVAPAAAAAAPLLSDLAQVFDPLRQAPAELALLVADGRQADQRAWGAAVASGAALRYRYRPLQVSLAPAAVTGSGAVRVDVAALAGRDLALVGTAEQLAPWLEPALRQGIQGAFLALRPLDAVRGSVALVISGRTPAEVAQAVQAFQTLNFPLPRANQVLVQGVQGEAGPAPQAALLGRGLTLAALGRDTVDIARQGGAVSIGFELPSDWFASDRDKARLTLDYSHSAGLRADSELQLSVNGVFVESVSLAGAGSNSVQGYQLQLPMRLLRAGHNELTLRSALYPAQKQDCSVDPRSQFAFTLYGSSRIEFPALPRAARLPDLALLGRTGFPYSDDAPQPLHLRLLDAEPQTLAAAWTLVAKLAQQRGAPFAQTVWSQGDGPAAADELVFATHTGLPARYAGLAPLRLGPEGYAPFSWQVAAAGRDWLPQAARETLRFVPQPVAVATQQVRMALSGGDAVYAMQFKGPEGHTLTVFSAADAALLERGLGRLVRPELWATLGGDLALWQPDAGALQSQRTDAEYFVGHLSPWAWADFHLSRNPLLWVAAVIVALAVAVLATRLLLLRFMAWRHGARAREATE